MDLPSNPTKPESYVYMRIDGGLGGIALSPLASGTRSELQNAFDARVTVIGAGTVAPEVADNLTLVLRKGVSNLLQHSGAECAQLSFSRHESNLVIVLADQGIGRVKEFFTRGGLSNIRLRAERVGASVDWIAGEPGCQMMVLIPLENVLVDVEASRLSADLRADY